MGFEVAAYVGGALAGGLGMYFGIGGFFEWRYYRRRAQAAEWKCQPARWPSPTARRREIALGAGNMVLASIVSGLIAWGFMNRGASKLFWSLGEHGLIYVVVSTVVYLLGTDLFLYWAHRGLHTPRLYRLIHRVHHRWGSPTAFTATAMHPLELLVYQSTMLVPLFLVPLHVGGVILVLIATNFYALVDHSGVRQTSIWPFIAPSQFHDDHHAFIDVNFGQSFAWWDRLFGTARE